MKTWVTSDIHFSHTNILKFCADSRPFHDILEMNTAIINNHNSVVGYDDLVYILGDIAFTDAISASRLLNRMNGKKILIKGNHDVKLLRDQTFRNCFAEIHEYLELGYKEFRIVLFHYPIWEWDMMHRGALHFHGHCHARPTNVPGRILDVSMDGNNCFPYSMDEAVQLAMKKIVRSHH
jgi:calcineurin-like phosphoesterase family protein